MYIYIYMALIDDKYLFIHINKSGGGFIMKNIEKNLSSDMKLTGSHRSLNDFINLTKSQYNICRENIHVFTIVRNPWDRMLSLYLYYKTHNASEFFSNDNNINSDFKRWIKYIYSDNFDRRRIHSSVNIFNYCFSNQLNWLRDSKGNINIDTIFKFEDPDLHKKVKLFLEENLKVQDVDTETRCHPTIHNHYSSYYDYETMLLVKKHYQKDIDYFGYTYTSV
jgi:hypothetical protein